MLCKRRWESQARTGEFEENHRPIKQIRIVEDDLEGSRMVDEVEGSVDESMMQIEELPKFGLFQIYKRIYEYLKQE